MPTHKIVADQVFRWRPDLITQDGGTEQQWEALSGIAARAVLVGVTDSGFQVDGGSIGSLADRNRRGNHRPATEPVPESQQLSISLLYGNDLLSLPVTVAYRLNPYYIAESKDACINFDGLIWVMLMGILFMAGAPSLFLLVLLGAYRLARPEAKSVPLSLLAVLIALAVSGVGPPLVLYARYQLPQILQRFEDPQEKIWDMSSSVQVSQVEWPKEQLDNGYYNPDLYLDYNNVIATLHLPGGYHVEEWDGLIRFERSTFSPYHLAAALLIAPPQSPEETHQDMRNLLHAYGFDETAQAQIDDWYTHVQSHPTEAHTTSVTKIVETESGLMSITLSADLRPQDGSAVRNLRFAWMK